MKGKLVEVSADVFAVVTTFLIVVHFLFVPEYALPIAVISTLAAILAAQARKKPLRVVVAKVTAILFIIISNGIYMGF